jgi:Fe-S cluster assembly protein SufD
MSSVQSFPILEKSFADAALARNFLLSATPAANWFAEQSERASNVWRAQGLPTRREENWKYTNTATLNASPWEIAILANLPKEIPAQVRALNSELSNLVFLNGQLVDAWSTRPKQKGVTVLSLAELWKNQDPASQKLFADLVTQWESVSDEKDAGVFAALNASLLIDGLFIHLDKSVRLEKPLALTFLQSAGSPQEDSWTVSSPRIFIHLESLAEASILESVSSIDEGKTFSNSLTHGLLEAGARLTYCKVQNENQTAAHVGGARFVQKRDSHLENYQISLGARLCRQDLNVRLIGEGAEASLDGLYLVQGDQHVDNHTVIEHVSPLTTSSQLYKGILDDSSRAVFNGKVHIHPKAQKSNAAQLNSNLSLSMKAEVDTKPELQIEADDVKATHGATVGQLDPEQIFYFETRAIDKMQAVQILAQGFAQDVVDRISDAQLRAPIRTLVNEKLSRLHIDSIVTELL